MKRLITFIAICLFACLSNNSLATTLTSDQSSKYKWNNNYIEVNDNYAYIYMTKPGSLYQLAKGCLDGVMTDKEWGQEVWNDITDITIRGYVDARDFSTLKWNFRSLEYLNMYDVKIVGYSGNLGTVEGYYYTYEEDVLPLGAFFYWMSNRLRPMPNHLIDEGMPSLRQVKLPIGIKGIGRNAFARAYNLIEITIPEGVTYIGDHAFSICTSLERLYLPRSIESIGLWVFNETENLSEVHIYRKEPSETNASFTSTNQGKYIPKEKLGSIKRSDIKPGENKLKSRATLYVPLGCKGNYQSWYRYFETIVEEY